MQFLSSTGRVFLLGAGASAFAGYPLANGLLPFVRDLQNVDQATKDVASRVLGKLSDAQILFTKDIVRSPDGATNLEQLLTYLELYHTFPGRIFSANPWNEVDSASVRRVITEKFLTYQFDLAKRVWGQNGGASAHVCSLRQIADRWAALIKPGDVILTFNWDILHEVILWRAGLWAYRDGYGFQCGNQGHRDPPSRVLTLKLHGSVNWVQDHDSDCVSEIAHVSDFFVGSQDWDQRNHVSQAQTDSGRKLVLPTYLKDISSNRVLLQVWTEAQQVLAQAKELFVVGYSLNPVDHPARLLIGTALSRNKNLNLTVVSPDAHEWFRLAASLDISVVHIRKKFEEWVMAP